MNCNKKTSLFRGCGKFLLFSLIGWMFLQCETKELEFMQPYQFVNDDFDGIVDLPAVADPDPVIEEPVAGEILESEEVQNIEEELGAAESEADVEASTVTILEKIAEFVLEQPEETSDEVIELADVLTEEQIAAIFDAETELDPEFIVLAEEANEDLDIGELFPDIILPPLDEENVDGRKDYSMPFDKNLIIENLRTATLVGPCADAARDSYDAAISRLVTIRDGQLATAQATFQTRFLAAQQRFEARNLQAILDYQNRLQASIVFVNRLLVVSTRLARFNVSWARWYRWYAWIYMIRTRDTIDRLYRFALQASQVAYDRDIANAEQQRDSVRTTIQANFANAVANADSILSAALNTCHNQGAGN
nr:hypothetical protein [Cytophagales bacterium]